MAATGATRTIIHLANRSAPWSLPTAARENTEILPPFPMWKFG